MKQSRFTDEQIIGFLKQADAGMSVKELCRSGGFSQPTFYKWRSRFGGMEPSDAAKLQVLEHMWREELSFNQTIHLFNLRGGGGVVSTWERQYHQGGITALAPKPRGRPKQMKSPTSPKPLSDKTTEAKTLQELQRENEYLRAEVAYLKKLDALVRAKQQAVQTKPKP
jgi:transposase-like protein